MPGPHAGDVPGHGAAPCEPTSSARCEATPQATAGPHPNHVPGDVPALSQATCRPHAGPRCPPRPAPHATRQATPQATGGAHARRGAGLGRPVPSHIRSRVGRRASDSGRRCRASLSDGWRAPGDCHDRGIDGHRGARIEMNVRSPGRRGSPDLASGGVSVQIHLSARGRSQRRWVRSGVLENASCPVPVSRPPRTVRARLPFGRPAPAGLKTGEGGSRWSTPWRSS